MEQLGFRLRNERKRLGLTQSAFAKIGGVEPNAQIRYENGQRSPKADYLQKLSNAGVNMTYLFSGAGEHVHTAALQDTLLPIFEGAITQPCMLHISSTTTAGLIYHLNQTIQSTSQMMVDLAKSLGTCNPTSVFNNEELLVRATALRRDSDLFAAFAREIPEAAMA